MAKKADEAKNAKLMDDRAKALETTLASLEKQFGKGTVMKLGEQAHMKVDVVPTGCLELDLALGVGGIPKGRIIEIYGPESSGKTTVALHIVAESQKRGGIAGVHCENAGVIDALIEQHKKFTVGDHTACYLVVQRLVQILKYPAGQSPVLPVSFP